VRQVAAGYLHTGMVTEAGDLLMCGCGDYGRLGLGEDDRATPTLVARAVFDGEAVLMVACGAYHTVVATEGGGVYTFGHGEDGRLGHGDEENQLAPRRVPAAGFNGEQVVMVAAGRGHTVALSEAGHVFTWGNGEYGQLGHGDEEDQAFAALRLGQALWARARAEHHQAAPDATSCGGVSAASADTLQEAETWLRTALDLAVSQRDLNLRMDAQVHLACVAMMKGDEDEAVELLSQHLQGWVDDVGRRKCAGCGQMRGEDAPMLSCDGCRVVRCVYAATPVPCGRDWHACGGVADRGAWMDDAGTAMRVTSGWRGRARLNTSAMASRTKASARC